jgi:hypothetical protein
LAARSTARIARSNAASTSVGIAQIKQKKKGRG